MFAGPNGSGKTTIIRDLLQRSANWYGIYLNADDVEKQIKDSRSISLADYSLHIEKDELVSFFAQSTQVNQNTHIPDNEQIQIQGEILSFIGFEFNSYHAATLIEFFRYQFLKERISFTFETVMSHKSKVEFLAEASKAGFRTYLYFVATENPEINIRRVRNRVADGGHTVSDDKIRSRYSSSINLLESAIRNSDPAFLFDTSEENNPIYFAEITDGQHLDIKEEAIPAWSRSILAKFADLDFEEIPSDSQ